MTKQYKDIYNRLYTLSHDQSQNSHAIFDTYVHKKVYDDFLKDSYFNLRSPQSHTCKIFLECISQVFFVHPNDINLNFFSGNEFIKINSRCNSDIFNIMYDAYDLYVSSMKNPPTFLEVFHATIHMEMAMRYGGDLFLQWTPDFLLGELDDSEKNLLRTRPR